MIPITVDEPPTPRPKKEIPPYNGFGTEEDSLTSCKGLEPRPPQRDFFQFIHKDRLENYVIFKIYNDLTAP